jgi:putative spermidine/putrescine transport system permease protein
MSVRRTLLRFRGIGILLVLLLVIVSPFVAFALNAFSFRWFFPELFPKQWTLRAWERIFSARFGMLHVAGRSIALAISVTIAAVLIGLPAGRALGMRHFRLKRLVEFLVLAPAIIPPIAIGMGLSVIFNRLGISGTWTGVAVAHLIPVLPYVILTLAARFKTYDSTLEAQARTLGAGPVRVFWMITVPSITPAVMVAALFAFLISFSQYMLTMLIGAGRIITLPVLLFSAIPGGDTPAIAALSTVFVLPSLLILLLTARYLGSDKRQPQEWSSL